ncbi:hypothetical protein K443DRAFT_107845 [Laccaria amethystina LaAM-08-1]|uniref:Protein kinase domain-containing protein n=1 Tax=Laccaria amethystina LaAM-08-1 TaxID=1095629 RepID=A0A0C9WUQ9_9AGAR|nr:hypothetical protein K443DRAFT_107845 [Laccaria amethystina LaAM-08-1]
MGNLFSGGRALPLSIVGFIALVGWVARAKIWRKKAVPSQATNLAPEWQDLFHRNYYGRRRLQMIPNSDRQNMLRDFVLISMRDSPNCVNKMRNYLGKREMPKHLYIASESIIDMEAYRAVVTPYYRNGNILEFINRRAVSDGRKLQLIMQIAQGLAYLHSLGTVHGNLYPANILVTDDEDIVLTDAEIYTKVVKLMLLRIRIPQSIVYKSHQELDGQEVPTKNADVFAFASTSYAIITGRAPFSEIANPYQRILKITQNGHRMLPKPLSTSPMLWDLLRECWSAEPTKRPTMSDVVYWLGRATPNRRSLLIDVDEI